jgi:cytidylate kinase
MRDLAAEQGTALDVLQKRALTDNGAIDLEIDRRQVSFALANPKFVMGSRLAIWLDDDRVLSKLHALQKPQIEYRFWLSTPLQERAKRVAARESRPYGDALSYVERRDEENAQRYAKLYGINVDSPPFGTMEIDTTRNDAQAVARIIIDCVERRNLRGLKV